MAAMLASRRAPMAKIMEKLLFSNGRSAAAAPAYGARSFNTNAQMRNVDDERSIDVDRQSSESRLSGRRGGDMFPGFFSDVLDPFNPTRSLSQLLNMMDQMLDSPFAAASRGMSGGARRGWDVREDDNALYLRIDLPGLSKEDVLISVEQGTLIIRGEVDKESEDEEGPRRYSTRIDLPAELYKLDEIKAEMKNGVLKVIVPKVKPEERKDVFKVQIE